MGNCHKPKESTPLLSSQDNALRVHYEGKSHRLNVNDMSSFGRYNATDDDSIQIFYSKKGKNPILEFRYDSYDKLHVDTFDEYVEARLFKTPRHYISFKEHRTEVVCSPGVNTLILKIV